MSAVGLAACVETRSAFEEADGSFDTEALPRLMLEEELRIGSLADPDYGFSRIGLVDVDGEGRVYVAETIDLQIRVYSPTGGLLYHIGGAGDGPGEFQAAITRFGVTGDTVWAVDTPIGSPGWLLLFRRDGEPLSKRRIERVTTAAGANGHCSLVAPRRRAADGRFMGETVMGGLTACPTVASGSPVLDDRPPPVPRVRFDNQGEVVDTAGWYEEWVGLEAPPSNEIIAVGRSEYLLPLPSYVTPAQILLPDGRIQVDRAPAATPERGTFGQ